MQWQDEGVVLSARRHGESSAVASLLTREHGRHAGLVKGGMSKRQRPHFQPGNRLVVTWRARLAEHLGQFTAEPVRLVTAQLIDEPDRLAGLASACALLEICLAERDPHPRLYDELIALLDVLVENRHWPEHYVAFELALLAELGFGLDLSACAVTGAREGLAYVSPASGRAVTRAGAGAYVDRLLPLPPFLVGEADADTAQILGGFRLTGAFLRRHVFDATERAMPGSRDRLIARLTRRLQSET